jgi:hypothetical protein
MVMESHHPVDSPDLDDLVQAGRWATECAHQTIGSMAREG